MIRTLEDEIGRGVGSRMVNPKWINGIKRHGYKGAFEITATVDYLFAFAATTGVVKTTTLIWCTPPFSKTMALATSSRSQRPALRDIAQRLNKTIKRDLWVPKSNSACILIDTLL